MRGRSLGRVLFCLVLMGSAAVGSATERLSVGSVGITFDSADWERGSLAPDLGKDQFLLVGADAYLVFFERFLLLEERADFMEQVEVFLSQIESRLEDAEVDPEIRFERYEGFSRASCRLQGTASGLKLGYQLDVISAGDGVGYFLLGWTLASNTQRLYSAVEEVLQSLQFPEPGSDWFEKRQLTPHRFDFGEWNVELTFRDSVFQEAGSEFRQRYSLFADEESLAVHLFLTEISGDSEEVLQQVVEVASSDETYEELLRFDFESSVGPGKQVLLRSEGEPPMDMALAVIALGEETWVDLRMVTTGPSGHREDLWNRFLESLRVEKEAQVDAFPVVEAAGKASETRYFTSSGRMLLEASQFLAKAPWRNDVEVRDDGALLMKDSKRIVLVRVPPDEASSTGDSESGASQPQVLYRGDDYFTGDVVAWGNDALLVEPGEEARWVRGGELVPAGFRADRIAPAGNEVLVARSPTAGTLAGFGDLPVVGESRLLLRDRNGEERLVAEIPDRKVQALAFRDGQVLAAMVPRRSWAVDGGAAETELALIDVTDGSMEPIDRWGDVKKLAPLPGGWLISGRPAGDDEGVYLFNTETGREKLLSGGQLAVGGSGDDVTYIADRCLDLETDSGGCIYRAPLEVIREHGPGLWPFGVRGLNKVAAESFEGLRARGGPSLHLSTPEDVRALLKVADQRSLQALGAPLPTAPEGIDLLLGTLVFEQEVSELTLALLSALVTEALLEQGAQWVVPRQTVLSHPGLSGWEGENAFALGVHPPSVVLRTLYDGESWYEPLNEADFRARGRQVFVGPDPRSLRDAVRDADTSDLPRRVRDGDPDQIVALLEAHPQNTYLREEVYRQLGAQGRRDTLVAVGGALASSKNADPLDHAASIAGRLSGELSPDEVEELIGQLRSAIERAPEAAVLYLLLGSAYERSSVADKAKYSRACYQKVQELEPFGSLAPAAREALERLAGSEG